MSLIPLESNPEVMNKFLQIVGVPDKWKINDVYGLDSEALSWIPRPVLALILLFPCSEKYYKYTNEQRALIKETGQTVAPDLYYMKQTVSNACGTVALIHSIANNLDQILLADGRFKQLLDDSRNLSPEERGELLQKQADQILNVHQELAMEGQTEANANLQVNNHFISLVQKGGYLYELDGQKEFPINHGPTTAATFLEDAARICREFIERDSEDINFTVMALTAGDN